MDVSELTQNPAMLIVGAIGVVLILWIAFSLRGPGRATHASAKIAAVEAERDVLRANHAVEVAALEGKLAEMQARQHKDMDATFRLKEMEKVLADARAKAKADADALAAASEQITALAGALEAGKRHVAELSDVAQARERAEAELASERQTLAALRVELAANAEKLAAANAERNEGAATLERLTRERDEARTALAAEKAAGDTLRREAAARDGEDVTSLRGEIARLAEREAQLGATLGERDAALAQLAARERSANDTMSRLAYEGDGLKERVAAAERLEREARNEIEKLQALLELRLQKVYALEGQLRDRREDLEQARRRAVAAEAEARALREANDGGDAAFKSRIGALEAELAKAAEDGQRLRDELAELREGAPPPFEAAREIAEALNAAQAEAEELRAEMDRMRKAQAATVSPADIAVLRDAIRTLAERFVGEAEPVADAASMEPSLAEKIRAFKASRDAKVRRPLRIAAPKEG